MSKLCSTLNQLILQLMDFSVYLGMLWYATEYVESVNFCHTNCRPCLSVCTGWAKRTSVSWDEIYHVQSIMCVNNRCQSLTVGSLTCLLSCWLSDPSSLIEHNYVRWWMVNVLYLLKICFLFGHTRSFEDMPSVWPYWIFWRYAFCLAILDLSKICLLFGHIGSFEDMLSVWPY